MWKNFLSREKKNSYFIKILNKLAEERANGKIIYPNSQNIFKIFRLTQWSNIKVVILGQDPYPGPAQANGLAFSVSLGVPIPPTLINIYKELNNDSINFQYPNHGYLGSWVQQGIMLLNTILTVEAGKPSSHVSLGWEIFTDKVISLINEYCENIVFLLWGRYAQRKRVLIKNYRHLVLQAPHPSPLSAHKGFFGCRHFSKTNQWLIKSGIQPIDWTPHILD
ncbi:MAG: uracil-DNA glycosylase [Candidatus Dasytiphilus stammeri]